MSVGSLSDFVNIGKLEDVLQSLTSRLDAQQGRIETLETQLAQSVPLTRFNDLQHRLDSALQHLDEQMQTFDERLTSFGAELDNVSEALAAIPTIQTQIDQRIDQTAWQKEKDSLHHSLSSQISALQSDKASKSVVSSLESSQHRLVEEILAIQKVLQCKVDRVEIPLLDVASEKMQFLLDFQRAADEKLSKLESDLRDHSKLIQSKESRETFAARMQKIQAELSKKVDANFVKDQILAPLHRAEDDIVRLRASEDALDRLMDDYHRQMEKLSRTEKTASEVREEMTRMNQAYEALVEEVSQKADFHSLDKLMFDNSDEVDRLLAKFSSEQSHIQKVQQTYLAEIRAQLREMGDNQSNMETKLQVAMKFIDWFTDVKMKHM